MIILPKDHWQTAEDPAILRCPACGLADRWVLIDQSRDDGQGNSHLVVRCKRCGAFNNPIGSQDWIKQIAKMAEHQ